MLWVLKRTASMRRSVEHPKQMFKLMGKKIFTILCSNLCLSKPIILAGLCGSVDWFETYFVGTPEDRFSHVEAHMGRHMKFG